MTQADIAAVLRRVPELGSFGIGVFSPRSKSPEQRNAELARERAALLADAEGCTRAETWLAYQAKTRGINPRHSSYGLKHVAEEEVGYMTNGAFIAAAVHLGFAYRLVPGSPNVGIGISERSLTPRRIRAAR